MTAKMGASAIYKAWVLDGKMTTVSLSMPLYLWYKQVDL